MLAFLCALGSVLLPAWVVLDGRRLTTPMVSEDPEETFLNVTVPSAVNVALVLVAMEASEMSDQVGSLL